MANKLVAVSDRLRRSIDSTLTRMGYGKDDRTRTALCKKAGFTEGTLRNFLNPESVKPTKAIGIDKAKALADALGISLGELIGESAGVDISKQIMRECFTGMIRVISKDKIQPPIENVIDAALKMYDHCIDSLKKGKKITVDEALAKVFLKLSVA